MYKIIFVCLLLLTLSCNSGEESAIDQTDTTVVTDTPIIDTTQNLISDSLSTNQVNQQPNKDSVIQSKPTSKVYSNQRFKDVTVARIGEHRFRIRGKGQIFEAAFSWVVEDGHNEIKEGHEMTDAGAPAWGNFDFIVDVKKQRPNSTLHLILYEASAKDGSRQHLLPLLLY